MISSKSIIIFLPLSSLHAHKIATNERRQKMKNDTQ